MCETEPYNIPFWAVFKTCNLEIIKSKELSNILDANEVNKMIILIKNQDMNDERIKDFEKYCKLIANNSI